MKILTIIGARPQFIKAAVVSRAINDKEGMEEIIVHTGQHFDKNMSEIFFEEMSIPKPNYNLNINGLQHGAMTGQMMQGVEEILLKEKPDFVLVYGDTNSTLAGALAAVKLHIKLAHVEAGLRSFNMKMPEEINRILTDRISNLLFCPTDRAFNNLKREGFDQFACDIYNVGDVMQDAAIFYSGKAKVPQYHLPETFVLSTIHRAENTDDPNVISGVFEALEAISKSIPIVLPLHPRTKLKMRDIYPDLYFENIHFIEPVGYLEMIYLLKNCQLVMTDSGGLQKEAFFFKKPCITLRNETEWVELVDSGYNQICGSDKEIILDAFNKITTQGSPDFSKMLYGSGKAAVEIVEILYGSSKN